MFGIPLGRQLELWWHNHGGKWDDPEWVKFIEFYVELMKLKADELLTKHENINKDNKKVIGMSKSIGCTKSALLEYVGAEKRPKTGSEQFTFWIGHSVEVAVLAMLKAIGMGIEVQYPVYSKSGKRASSSDAKATYLGKETLISVKSTGYKMSGGRKNSKTGKYNFVRRGFASLPMEGAREAEHSHWVQLNQEMLAADIDQAIIIYAAKDMVKVYENDEWLSSRNGSLTFYAEFFKLDRNISIQIDQEWDHQIDTLEKTGSLEQARYLTKKLEWVDLNQGEYDPNNIWGGENQKITGTFNPCGGCDFVGVCQSIRSVNDLDRKA